MRKILLTLFGIVLTAAASAVEIPVGYTTQIAGSSGYIVNGKGKVSAATRVSPELSGPYAGNEIRGISVGIIDSKYCDSISVFVRETLDGEDLATGTITRKDADASKRPANGWNYIALDQPVAIPDGTDFYVGYIFYQRYKCEALSFVGVADENRTYVARGTGDWEDATDKGYLSIRMLIDGDNMPQYDLCVNTAEAMLVTDGVLSAKINVANNGQAVPAGFDLTFSAQGYSYVATVNNQIDPAQSQDINVVLNDVPEAVGFDYPLSVEITRIEGGEDAIPANNDMGVGVKVKRNVVVEEFTGTGCGYCPRGIAGMEKMRNKYGDQFIGIAIHQYNSNDPMYPSRYKNLGFTGAPSCTVDRKSIIDPYYGSDNIDICHDVDAEISEGSFAMVNVTGEYNDDKTAVNATATIKAQADLSGLKLSFVLTADSLTGTTSSWKQSNYYSSYSQSDVPEDMAIFASGGECGQSSFEWVFNDAAIGTYYEGGSYEMGLDAMQQGDQVAVDYSLGMPTKAALVNALQYDYVAVVAILLDANGTVINADKYYLGGVNPTGISEARGDAAVHEVARYTVDGRQVSAPQQGLNIVRMSNGKSYKVVVK